MSPDSKTLVGGATASGGDEGGLLYFWDIHTAKVTSTIRVPKLRLAQIAFSPDGSTLAAAGWVREGDDPEGQLVLCDGKSGKLLRRVTSDSPRLDSLAFSPDGKVIATGGGGWATGTYSVVLRSATTGEPSRTLPWKHEQYISALAFSPDGGLLASASGSAVRETVYVYDLTAGKVLWSKTGHLWGDLAFSHDGKILATLVRTGSVLLWNARSGERLGELDGVSVVIKGGFRDPYTGQVKDLEVGKDAKRLAFSPRGRILVGAGVNTLAFWDVDAQKLLGCSRASGHGFLVAYSPDGRVLATATQEQVTLWDVSSLASPDSLLDAHPITLSLGEKLAEPVDPLKGVPRIAYKKSPAAATKQASWIVEVDATEDGKKQATYTIIQGDKKLAVISIPGETGAFTGEEGKWEWTVKLFLQFSKARGKGTLRFALIDLNEFRTKDKATEARKLSNWVEIPIVIGP